MHKQTRLWLIVLPLTLLGACEQSTPTDLAPRSLARLSGRPSGNATPTSAVIAIYIGGFTRLPHVGDGGSFMARSTG